MVSRGNLVSEPVSRHLFGRYVDVGRSNRGSTDLAFVCDGEPTAARSRPFRGFAGMFAYLAMVSCILSECLMADRQRSAVGLCCNTRPDRQRSLSRTFRNRPFHQLPSESTPSATQFPFGLPKGALCGVYGRRHTSRFLWTRPARQKPAKRLRPPKRSLDRPARPRRRRKSQPLSYFPVARRNA